MAYECSICGKSKVKLWRPETSIKPLICADCAERLQIPRKGLIIKWSRASRKGKLKYPEGYISKKMSEMEEWTISDNGTIPSALGNTPDGTPVVMIETLKVHLSSYGFDGNILLIPAIPDENGIYLDRESIYRTGKIDLWRQFPTR